MSGWLADKVIFSLIPSIFSANRTVAWNNNILDLSKGINYEK